LLAPFDLPTVLSNVGYQGKSGSDWNIVKLPRITLGDIHVSRMTALPTAGFADPLLWNASDFRDAQEQAKFGFAPSGKSVI
jgi:hypothetical protein